MKYLLFSLSVALVMGIFGTTSVSAQYADGAGTLQTSLVYNLVEIPFIVFAAAMGFLVARKFLGGVFGSGMLLVALGLFVMAVGHIHLEIESITGISVLHALFGTIGGDIAFLLTLVLTWLLSGLGFYKLLKI